MYNSVLFVGRCLLIKLQQETSLNLQRLCSKSVLHWLKLAITVLLSFAFTSASGIFDLAFLLLTHDIATLNG